LRPSRKVPPEAWGAENREYPETAGVPGPRDPFLTPYMVPFGNAIWSGKYKRVVGITAAQSGKTDTILDVMGARIDQRPAPIVYVGPTKEFVTSQFEPRLMDLLDQSKALRDKVLRGKRMKQTLKWVSGVPIRLVHAGSSSALKSFPAALALVDEYDEMLANVKGQGDPLGLIDARGDTYADFVTAVVSTCSIGVVEAEIDPVSGLEFWKPGDPKEIESPIWKLWQDGTRFHWAWPCPHCGEYFIPRMKYLRWPDRATPAQAKRGAYLQCPQGCADPILNDEHKAWMNERGVAVAPGQTIDKAGRVHGEPPDSSTWSMWTSGLASPFVSWGTRVETLLTARASGDPAKEQTATNAGFGELFAQGGGEVPEWQEVMERRLPYKRGEVPAGVLRVVAAVDVQKMSLIYGIRGFGSRGTSWLLDFGQLYGPTDDGDVWAALIDLLLTPIGGMQIEAAFIDSGFRPDKPSAGDEHRVYEFARRFQWLVTPTKGASTKPRNPFTLNSIEVTARGKKAPYTIKLAYVDTDFFKSLVHSRIRTPVDSPGAFFVPEDITEDYCRQLVSEARTVHNNKPLWVQRSRQNHFLDVEALLALGGYMRNVDRIPEGAVRIDAPDGSQKAATPAPVEEPDPDDVPPRPVAAPAPIGSIRDRFASRSYRLNR
jgi:phage terminase large subunit GpA-like protein